MQKAKSFRKITLLQELRSLALSLAEPWTTITFPELILNPWLILFTLPYFPFTSLLRQTSYFFHSLFLPQLFPIFDLVGLTHTDAEWMFEWDSVSNVSNPKSMKIWHWIFFSSSLNIALSCSFQSLLSLWSNCLWIPHSDKYIYIYGTEFIHSFPQKSKVSKDHKQQWGCKGRKIITTHSFRGWTCVVTKAEVPQELLHPLKDIS